MEIRLPTPSPPHKMFSETALKATRTSLVSLFSALWLFLSSRKWDSGLFSRAPRTRQNQAPVGQEMTALHPGSVHWVPALLLAAF